ncbi:YhcN/YlaJ family sporulation lipoprotein [Tumebacillus sp. ITR2]|uniref:YhcN/YlaJ family sporulation lipoprotein n=1 Tax=Tumebacillus amylolyticus TaxID=2801339 RepID=A0ABS1J5D0_9BACL|nr:YhcN/YlaJ family sporulation lipoprotein [Tumebacillus amylolyticus]MBL0385410.1 YhcN/YlaJ family sporulation lipoprotein [Tumebacillus amylolyticus]
MQMNKWVRGLAVMLAVVTLTGVTGCTKGAQEKADNRYGINTVEIAPGQDLQKVPNWDNKNIDMDGDGDREHLSGRNNIANPSVDLRSFAHPGGGSDLTQGVYPHTFTADRIADLAHSVNGIANARALVIGQTAIVALNLDKGVKPEAQANLVQTVRQRILVQAPEFKRVHITADRALQRRVQRIADEIRSGHSLSMFNDDIMDLTRRIPAIGPSMAPAIP